MEDLIKIAREKYPVGTKFIAFDDDKSIKTVTGTNFKKNVDGTGIVLAADSIEGSYYSTWSVYLNGQWAKIISDNMYKGDLKDFPPEIVEKMLWWQEKQGNKRDVSVFERHIVASKFGQGFDWEDTEEGEDFWDGVIGNKNFDFFFEKYPKQDVVLGVKLEKGKDYYVTEKNGNWILRFSRIVDCRLYDLGALCGTNFYKENKSGWGDISYIKLIKPVTIQESQHLSECIQAGKYVEMKNYEYEVVHCETQEQWDFVLSKYPDSLSAKLKSGYSKDICLIINNEGTNANLNYFKDYNSLIYSFNEWCIKFNHQFKEEFKVGDWVCAKGTGHTKDNAYFPKDVAWQIERVDHLKDDFTHVFVNHSNNPNNVQGGSTYISDIRKALPHEIPQLENDLQSVGRVTREPNSKVKVSYLQYNTGDEFKPIHNLSLGSLNPSLCSEEKPYYIKSKEVKQGLIVRTIEPKQVKQESKLVPIKLNNHSRLKLK